MNQHDGALANTEAPADRERQGLPLGPMLFCITLALVGTLFIGIAVWRVVRPAEEAEAIPKRDIAGEARQLIRQSKPSPLSEPLANILAEAQAMHFESYQHALVGKPAPEFSRPDVDGKLWSLKDELKQGPVVVIFYLGYYCNHCVSQLFDANEDAKYFREMGASLIALSPDSAATTKEKYQEYGPFSFAVLSDPDNKIAESYGIFTQAKGDKAANLDHGTFVIAQDGIVKWAAFGPAPFGHNPTLLYELSKLRR